jgi:hypothetical protein
VSFKQTHKLLSQTHAQPSLSDLGNVIDVHAWSELSVKFDAPVRLVPPQNQTPVSKCLPFAENRPFSSQQQAQLSD